MREQRLGVCKKNVDRIKETEIPRDSEMTKRAGTILDMNLVEPGRVRLFKVLGSTRS